MEPDSIRVINYKLLKSIIHVIDLISRLSKVLLRELMQTGNRPLHLIHPKKEMIIIQVGMLLRRRISALSLLRGTFCSHLLDKKLAHKEQDRNIAQN